MIATSPPGKAPLTASFLRSEMIDFDHILYYTGLIVWVALIGAGLLACLYYLCKYVVVPFWNTLTNLKVFLFGVKFPDGWTPLQIWQRNFAHRSGVREHWKSWHYLRRLAYIRLLREARKELHTRKED